MNLFLFFYNKSDYSDLKKVNEISFLNCKFKLIKIILRSYRLFLKIRYKMKPLRSAKKPFKAPKVSTSGMMFASCSHDNTANMMPKAEMKSQISFLVTIF